MYRFELGPLDRWSQETKRPARSGAADHPEATGPQTLARIFNSEESGFAFPGLAQIILDPVSMMGRCARNRQISQTDGLSSQYISAEIELIDASFH
jgi:hypothetical protein